MHGFFSLNLNVPPELEVKSFSTPHLVYLAGWLLIILPLCFILSRRHASAKEAGLPFLVFSLLLSEAARVVWRLYHGLFMVQGWLSLPLCSAFVFIGSLSLYIRNHKLKNSLCVLTCGVSMPMARMVPSGDYAVGSLGCFVSDMGVAVSL